MYEHRSRRRVEFADTDMAGIVHFSRFFAFMESAEHAFLRALGTPVHFEHEGQTVGWPRLEAQCRYLSPARLDDELETVVRVAKKGRTSMTWSFTIFCGSRRVAEGKIATICCVVAGDGAIGDTKLMPIQIPAFLADRIEEAPESPPEPSMSAHPTRRQPPAPSHPDTAPADGVESESTSQTSAEIES